MPRATNYLLACSMLLCVVIGVNPQKEQTQPATRVINGYSLQCQARGSDFPGACGRQNVGASGGFRCDKLYCAFTSDSRTFIAVETGKVLDGTPCRNAHICMKGQCVPTGDSPMPYILGPGPKYKCNEPFKMVIQGAYPSATSERPPVVSNSKPTLTSKSDAISTANNLQATRPQDPKNNRASSAPGPPSKKKKKTQK